MKYLCIFLFFSFVLFFYLEKRSFYSNANKTQWVTVWKRYGGKCLVIPGKYYGILKPNENYLETDNRNSLTIIWNKSISDSLIIFNSYGLSTDVKFSSPFIKYFKSKDRSQFSSKYYNNGKVRADYDYLMVDIEEGFAVLNGEKL